MKRVLYVDIFRFSHRSVDVPFFLSFVRKQKCSDNATEASRVQSTFYASHSCAYICANDAFFGQMMPCTRKCLRQQNAHAAKCSNPLLRKCPPKIYTCYLHDCSQRKEFKHLRLQILKGIIVFSFLHYVVNFISPFYILSFSSSLQQD